MQVITRRNAIFASGTALTVPVSEGLLASASPQDSVAASGHATVLNADLQAYAVAEFPQLTSLVRQGKLAPEGYGSISNSLHLLGRHIASVDTEKFRAAIVDSLDASSPIDLSGVGGVQEYYNTLAKHDPDLSRSEYQQSLILSAEQVAAAKKSLTAHPIWWHYHAAADALNIMSKNAATGTMSPASFNPRWNHYLLSDGVYHPGSMVHLENARFCGLSARQWCLLGGLVLASGITIASLLTVWEGGAAYAAAAWIAARIGWTIAQVASAARILATIVAAIGGLCGIFLS